MTFHGKASLGARHPIHNWDFADETARLAQAVTVDDVGKIARQLDNSTWWILENHSPVEWKNPKLVGRN
jgi:hypothetical protein